MKLFKKFIIIALFFLVSSTFGFAQDFRSFEIELNYLDGDLELRYVNVKLLDRPIESFGQYKAVTLSFEDIILNSMNFNIPIRGFFDAIDPETGEIIGGYMEVFNETTFTLSVPYYSDAKEIVLYDPEGNEKLRIGVGMYAKEIPKEVPEVKPLEIIEEIPPEIIVPEIKKPITSKWWFWAVLISAFLLIFWLILKLMKRKRTLR